MFQYKLDLIEFDNSHAKVKVASENNEIGKLEMLIITSRDPAPPGIDYLKALVVFLEIPLFMILI